MSVNAGEHHGEEQDVRQEQEGRRAAMHGTRLLLADGQGLFRQGLRAFLGRVGDLRVVAEAACVREARTAVQRERPDMVLTDHRLPGGEDGAVISELTRLDPGLPIIVLTAMAPEECLYAALRAGAQGFVMKEAPGDLVARAIAAVRAGDVWVQREAFARAVLHARGTVARGDSPRPSLTPRETEVLALLATGMSTAEIAEALFVASSTVRVHVLRVVGKLAARSRIDAVRRAIRLRLVDA
jgi:DNA-binding NarL/FixJ family response regulator